MHCTTMDILHDVQAQVIAKKITYSHSFLAECADLNYADLGGQGQTKKINMITSAAVCQRRADTIA